MAGRQHQRLSHHKAAAQSGHTAANTDPTSITTPSSAVTATGGVAAAPAQSCQNMTEHDMWMMPFLSHPTSAQGSLPEPDSEKEPGRRVCEACGGEYRASQSCRKGKCSSCTPQELELEMNAQAPVTTSATTASNAAAATHHGQTIVTNNPTTTAAGGGVGTPASLPLQALVPAAIPAVPQQNSGNAPSATHHQGNTANAPQQVQQPGVPQFEGTHQSLGEGTIGSSGHGESSAGDQAAQDFMQDVQGVECQFQNPFHAYYDANGDPYLGYAGQPNGGLGSVASGAGAESGFQTQVNPHYEDNGYQSAGFMGEPYDGFEFDPFTGN